ncbi:helix-turn-helix transcriptional regulator [Ralstonia soli]|uniref:Pyocin activator PrtN family protein n=1 Tax=Ralstonia soli TaxID=2953896 RepID=A0ABT1AHU2_9RALS|nr:pyocin activator PrtN family protein [Ralstonia soli]MCO5397970.1 pyocin activator PrtN family protein [Ralstonia soli]
MKSSLFLLAAQFDGRVLLTLNEVCDAIAIQKQTAYNRLSTGTFPIPMRKEGRNLVGDIRDVADYLDSQRAAAKHEHEKLQQAMAPY